MGSHLGNHFACGNAVTVDERQLRPAKRYHRRLPQECDAPNKTNNTTTTKTSCKIQNGQLDPKEKLQYLKNTIYTS